MRQIRFMVAPNALQDVLKALYVEENKDVRIELYVFKKDGDLVVVVTEHDKSKKEYSEGVKPSGITASMPPPWGAEPLEAWAKIPREKRKETEIRGNDLSTK